MKNCLKYITLITLAIFVSSTALAAGKFMPLKPSDRTLIHGKKFIGLGGGTDPIKMASLKQDYFSLRTKIHRLTPNYASKPPAKVAPKEEPIEQAVTEEALPSKAPLDDITPMLKPEPKKLAQQTLPSGKSVKHQWPVDETIQSRISSPFGYRTHPVTGKYSFHAGLDIAAPKGTSVVASSFGEVTDLGRHKNLGKYVKVAHDDGTYSLYGHLSKITAKIGHEVAQGQKIGEVGSTGRSTGPHLDYSLRRGDKAIDPQKHLKRRSSKQVASAN